MKVKIGTGKSIPNFEGAKVAKYCSRECQNKAYYERSADERRAKRREAYQKKKGQPQDP